MTTLEINTSNLNKINQLIKFASEKLDFDIKVVKNDNSIQFEKFSENELRELKNEWKESFSSISNSLKSI